MRTVTLLPGSLRGLAASALEVSAQLDAAAREGVTMTSDEAEALARDVAAIEHSIGRLRIVLGDFAMRRAG